MPAELLSGSSSAQGGAAPGTHHFTVDVEEYFQVSAFESRVARTRWESFESRIERSMSQLLELLDHHRARATFFVLGWIADRHRPLVMDLARAGHEVASHGWDHRRVTQQDPNDFRASVRNSKDALEDCTGLEVLGFRAPSFSIVRGCEWALDVLIEEGYRYDSSLFPIWRRGYGYPNALRDPHWMVSAAGCLAEIPPATLSRWGATLPAAGGAYFRLLPYALTRGALLEAQRRGVPGTFYIHPWEIDPEQPRLSVSWLTHFRHYGGLELTLPRLNLLLTEFRFRTIAETVGSL